ncbi:hypothetical protein WJX77_000890 [Trebouxia sp. C0004]
MYKPHDGKNVHFVDPPHPNWRPGDKLPHKLGSDNYIGLKPEEIGSDLYPALISAVCPRPIGFVCCLNSKGQRNLSPYSYFNVMNHDPALCVLGANRSAQRGGGGMKDFEQYVRETGEFTVNMISNWFVEAANFTSGAFDAGVDEVDMTGLTPMPSVRVKPPRVKESAVQFECRVKHIYDTTNSKGVTTGAIIIAEILLLHIHEGVAGKTPHGKTIVDIDKYEPIARLGGNFYCRVKEVFELTRPNEEQMSKRQHEYHQQTGESSKHTVDPPQEGDAK